MAGADFVIRDLEEGDLPALRQLTDVEVWNHSEEYLDFCRKVTPGGYKVVVDGSGNVISACGACRITDELGFIAFYITKPEMRGKGISKRVFDVCMDFLGDINVGLNASDMGRPMYASGSFKISTFKMLGFLGRPNYDAVEKIEVPASTAVEVVPIKDEILDAVLQYDDKVHQIPRHDIGKKWFSRPGMQSFVAMNKGGIVGYVCIGRAVEGYRVMPLYADDTVVARLLWKTAIGHVEKDALIEVGAVIPENTDQKDNYAVKLYSECINVIKPPFYNVRMFTRENIEPNLTVVYSISGYDICLV